MCLIVFSFNHHPKYPLILAGNRDEFYERPAKEAHFWDTNPQVLAGKDLKAGGTWLGVSERGEFGAITNYRNLYNPTEGDQTRGEIIPVFLTGHKPAKEKLTAINENKHRYSGFNLLAGSVRQLFYLNNTHGDFRPIEPGIHGISNAFLNTPWPKVEKARNEFEQITSSETIDKEAVFRLLKASDPFPEESLPDTGLSKEMEKEVSPIFIETEGYGTRCSSLLLIDHNGTVNFTEKTYRGQNGKSDSVKEFSFDTESVG